jgi:serine/threonine-protein kinase
VESDDRTGTVIAGTYKVEKQLGRGAFGNVWLTRRLANQEPVVLKILHPQWARVPAVVERFKREGQIAYRINHPNVAQVYDYSVTDDGVPYLALEFLEGGTLKDDLKKAGAFSIARCAELWAPVCDAVAVAHQAGVVHRDLKPENVMLTKRDGQHDVPVVLDFGIAKFLDSAEKLTSTGSMLGTPTYMAPEQCRGQTDLGPPADVYALGAICYELLSGQPPFSGRTVAELAMHHLLDPAPRLANVPPELADIVAKCMEKEPAARPSAQALADVLRNVARTGGARASAARQVIKPTGAEPPASSVMATVLSPNSGSEMAAQAAKRTAETKKPAQGGGKTLLVVAVLALVLAVGGLVAVVMFR